MPTAEHDLRVPHGWELTEIGISVDGEHALDFHVGLAAGGLVVLRDRHGEYLVPPEPAEDSVSPADWAVSYLHGGGIDFGQQEPLLRKLLVELCAMRDSELGSRSLGDLLYPGVPESVRRVLVAMEAYVYLHDGYDHVLATLAAAVAQACPTDPLWMMLVMVSSSGKGEALGLTDDVADRRLNDLTLAGLLSRTQGKSSRTVGLLNEYQGADALFTVADFSALLGDNSQAGSSKAELFNALRDIYDGTYSRTMNGGTAQWAGRLSLIVACTPAIDRFTAYADALGTRFLYFRQEESSLEDRRVKARLVISRTELAAHRQHARDQATPVIEEARARVRSGVSLSGAVESAIVDAAVLTSYGRASVPRTFNNAEVDGVVTTEEPGRVTGQLRMLAVGLTALDLSQDVILRVVCSAALSSMPLARSKVLMPIAAAEGPTSQLAVANSTGLHYRVAGRALDDWAAIGVVIKGKASDERSTASAAWALSPEYTDLVRKALSR